VLKVEIENIKMKLESCFEKEKEKNVVITNDNINMNDRKPKLFSEICMRRELVRSMLLKKIINMISDNDI
jgi:hypothetical protein